MPLYLCYILIFASLNAPSPCTWGLLYGPIFMPKSHETFTEANTSMANRVCGHLFWGLYSINPGPLRNELWSVWADYVIDMCYDKVGINQNCSILLW